MTNSVTEEQKNMGTPTENGPAIAPSAANVLLALAERCEREEPSRVLDRQIIKAALGYVDSDHSVDVLIRNGHSLFVEDMPRYTTSLDAAVTPEGWRVDVIRQDISGEWECALRRLNGDLVQGFAKTEIMARRSAELRARAALANGATPDTERSGT